MVGTSAVGDSWRENEQLGMVPLGDGWGQHKKMLSACWFCAAVVLSDGFGQGWGSQGGRCSWEVGSQARARRHGQGHAASSSTRGCAG